MSIKIALVGNPNSGKTTLFNALTGSNQFVGNWPGVTVEKKEGKLKGNRDVIITDLPGIYSLSPYTLEEVVARNYLLNERPDVILNIVDGSNLERNLYLTTQLCEFGIPVVIAVNMMDIVAKNGDRIDFNLLSKEIGCEAVAISAIKGTGVFEAAQLAVAASRKSSGFSCRHKFSDETEKYIHTIEERIKGLTEDSKLRFCAIKLFERDEKNSQILKNAPNISDIITLAESEFDDDTESIITNERYLYISSMIKRCLHKRNQGGLTASDKIDRVVTNRILALPIFAVVMFIVYYISVTTVGTWATDWANDGVFGDGWHLFGIGASSYENAVSEYELSQQKIDAFLEAAGKNGIDVSKINLALENGEIESQLLSDFAAQSESIKSTLEIEDNDGNIKQTLDVTSRDFLWAVNMEEPEASEYGIWVPGIPVIFENILDALRAPDVIKNLVLDGIVAGVGAVLGFVPQIFVLFLFLAFLEACGYMARIAFIMDRIFRKFGLSGKSFIPILVGTGCGIPGIMASRTIENDRDRKMTIMTTTFIPCGAKLPIIALIAGALFNNSWWVGPSAYFVGIAAIIISGVILKKTKIFAGDPAPFVMELPAYHIPTPGNIIRSMWERGSSFIRKAGTIILGSTVVLWFLQGFGFENQTFTMVSDLNNSLLAYVGNAIAWIFTPLGRGDWRAAVATVTGLIAKENVVGTFGVLFGFGEVAENGEEIWSALSSAYSPLAAYSFLVFNLLCAPCFAAMGAIKREMNSAKWTGFALGYQTIFAYTVALVIYQIGMLFAENTFTFATAAAVIIAATVIYLWVRPKSKPKAERKIIRV